MVYRNDTCCGEALRGVDPSRIHRTWSNAIHKRRGASLRGLLQPRIHRIGVLQFTNATVNLRGVWTPEVFTARGLMRCINVAVNPSGIYNPQRFIVVGVM